MSKVRDTQSKTFGSIAAIQTLVDNYPSLKNTDSIMQSLDVGTSLGYILSLLRVLGVTQVDLYDLIAKLLCGTTFFSGEGKSPAAEKAEKATNGILDAIEYAVKVALFANIKDLFGGCPIDVMIPDWMIEEQGTSIDADGNTGIKINLGLIDTFGVLNACPCDSKGSIFYFDTKPTIYGDEYNVNDVYKSSDFNAFLWYVVNKSGGGGAIWDNRVNVQSDLLSSVIEEEGEDGIVRYKWPLREKFFSDPAYSGKIKESGKTITKKNILRCRYINTGNVTDGDGLIKVTLPESRYRYRAGSFYLNRTIFEFNYDYIFSLHLFDAKTLVANIINTMLSLGSTIGVGVSFKKNLVRQQVSEMVRNVMVADSDEDNEESGDCITKFSNEQYDIMYKNAEMARDGNYQMGNKVVNSAEIDTDLVVEKIKSISESEDQNGAIKNALKSISAEAHNVPEISVDMNLSCDLSFIYTFLEQTVTEIVMQIMSPKITMLYAMNSAMMGDVTDINGWKNNFTFRSIDEFFARMKNLILNIIRQCLDLIIKELFAFLMEKIGPLIKLFVLQLLLETIKDYRDLIRQLITTCGMLGINIATYADGTLNIDDVRYADIVPQQTAPGKNNC